MNRPSDRTIAASATVALTVMFGLAGQGRAAVLTSGNAYFSTFDTNGTNNVFRVDTTDDDADNVFFANFYLRGAGLASASGGPVPISALGAVTAERPAADRVAYTAANGTLAARQSDVLTGGAAGSGSASVAQSFTLTNTSASATSLSLYFAADYDVAFDQSNPNDVTTVLGPSAIRMSDPVTGASLLTEASVTPSAYQVYPGAFDGYFYYFASLQGVPPLNNTPAVSGWTVDSAADGRDASFAFGWDVSLAPGQSLTYTVTTTHAVPEPTVVLPAVGMLAVSLGRRRCRSAC